MKTLTEEDVDKYTIFDVIMPLPGKDVAFPGGALGERYREFLKMDGLDPGNFTSKHKYVHTVYAKFLTGSVLNFGFSQGLQLDWIVQEDHIKAKGTILVRVAVHRPGCSSRSI